MLRRLYVRSSVLASHRFQGINSLWYKNSMRNFATEFKVFNCPEPGEATVEVTIKEWYVKPGDKVADAQEIGLAGYEKADFSIYAPYDGVISELFVGPGNKAIVHKPLIKFEVEASSSTKAEDYNKPASIGTSATSTTSPSSSFSTTQSHSPSQLIRDVDIKALPAARRLAKDNGVNLASIQGTGSRGHILKEDVLQFIQKGKQQSITATASTTTTTATQTSKTTPTETKVPIPKFKSNPPLLQDSVEQVTGLKVSMVKKMKESGQVPQFGYGDEILMDELVILRKQLKPLAEKYGVKLSFVPFILKATSLALRNYPMLNAHINEECTLLTHRSSHNLGVAIDSPIGLIVPNIKDCQNKSIIEIAADLDAIIDRAKKSKIAPKDIQGGTFTLSNIGAIGGTYCRPLVFVPEVCIGALGAIQTLPRYNKNQSLYPASIMAVSWSADHRIIDGATVARFSNEFKNHLEDPSSLLAHLL